MFVPTEPQKNLFERIDALYLCALEAESPQAITDFSGRVVSFDKTLCDQLIERFADDALRRSVPEWHKLVGSTPMSLGISSEAQEFIVQQISGFVMRLEEEMLV